MTIAVMIEKMSEGLGRTCGIFFLTLLFSLPLGLIMALLRRSRFAVVRGIMRGAISILRGTPLMLQLLAVTYGPFYISKALKDLLVAALATESFMAGLGDFAVFLESALGWLPFVDIEAEAIVQFVCEMPKDMLIKIPSNKLIPIIIGFSINYAAYFAEIYRGGIESMPVGQYEAAAVLGYSKYQTFMRIILPQVIKRILPSMTNEIITLVKDTSMAFTVAYQEMFTIGKQIANSQSSFMPFIIAGVFYYVFNSLVAFVMSRIEKGLNYYR